MRNAATAVRYALWAPLRAGGKPLSPGGDGPRVLEEQELPITVNNFGGVQNTIQFSVGSHSSFDVERIDDHYVALHYEVTDEEPSVSSAQSEKKDDDAANLAALGLRIQGTVLVNACETPTSFSLVRFFDDEDGRAGDIRVSARRASPKCADPRPTTVKRNHVVHVALVDDADRRTVREYAITTDGASRISLRDGLNYPIPTVSAAGATMTFLPVGSSIDLAFKEGHAEPYLQVVFAQPQFTRYVNRSRPYVERLAVSTYVDLGQRRIVFAGERRRHPIHIEAWSE